MSQRPRFAGDGRLRLPEGVEYQRDSHFLRARLTGRMSDPFDWTDDRLLLAESFARLDLSDPGAVCPWFETHGFVDRVDFHGGSADVPDDEWLSTRNPDEMADRYDEVYGERGNVAWHLATLARLSEHRWTMDWDPSWARLVVANPEVGLIVGGPDAGAELLPRHLVEHLRKPHMPEIDRPVVDGQDRLYAAIEGLSIVTVAEPGWFGYWRPVHGGSGHKERKAAREKAKVLGSTWDQAIELERILIVPYVEQAADRRFTVERQPQEVHGMGRSVLVPREERVWRSILAPIYLQLFEALRRITEGEPGAAICRECGRPFLVLDARRRFFCNDRERFRHAQRERRKRLAGQAESDLDLDGGAVEVKVPRSRR